MMASLATLRFLLIAVDVSPPPVSPPPSGNGHARFSNDRNLETSRSRAAAVRGDDCSDDMAWDGGFGNCSLYAPGAANQGFCTDDDACDACGCACSQDQGCSVAAGDAGSSGGAVSCSNDEEMWDGGMSIYIMCVYKYIYVCMYASHLITLLTLLNLLTSSGYGGCSSYAAGGENEGFCADDGACEPCCKTCSPAQCGALASLALQSLASCVSLPHAYQLVYPPRLPSTAPPPNTQLVSLSPSPHALALPSTLQPLHTPHCVHNPRTIPGVPPAHCSWSTP